MRAYMEGTVAIEQAQGCGDDGRDGHRQVQAGGGPRVVLRRRGRQLRQDLGARRPRPRHQQGHVEGALQRATPPHRRCVPQRGLCRGQLLARGGLHQSSRGATSESWPTG
jgi:hypothetical protein